jgi:hypothetical protein
MISLKRPIPVAARSKAWVCGRSLAGTAGLNPGGCMNVSCEWCVLSGKASATGRSLVQRNPTEWCVSLRGSGATITPTMGR